jgi:hypothetical protein
VLSITNVINGEPGFRTSHTYTIRDNDPTPVASISPGLTVSEPDTLTGHVDVQIGVSLSAPSSFPITIPFIAPPTTATPGLDFTILSSLPLTFPPGTVTSSIYVTIHADAEVEGAEDVGLQLLSATNAIIGNAFASVNIADDDCLGSGTFTVCPTSPRQDAVTLPSELDTGFSPSCADTTLVGWAVQGQTDACVIFARSITVDNTWARGSRPLVLVASESIIINGTLDVSAHHGWAAPGNLFASCGDLSVNPGSRAGGAGGSLMSAGGTGGAHNNPVGAGGIPSPALSVPPSILRAGCLGQWGGGNNTPASPGGGGGAVYLLAGTSITLQPNSAIDASGGFAIGGVEASCGGSGGGSGGMILLDAPTIISTGAFVVANGGAGSEGSTSSQTGASGGMLDPRTPFTSALGGSGTQGGDGGRGFAYGFAAGNGSSANNNNGGGGGGGGAGYIRSTQPLTGASVSPPSS